MLVLVSLVFLPLYGGQVYALFVHFPDGAEVAHVVDALRQRFDGVVDVFFGGESPEAKPDRRVRQVVAQAQSHQYIAGFQRSRCAGRA